MMKIHAIIDEKNMVASEGESRRTKYPVSDEAIYPTFLKNKFHTFKPNQINS